MRRSSTIAFAVALWVAIPLSISAASGAPANGSAKPVSTTQAITAGGSYYIGNYYSAKCMNVPNANPRNGTRVVQYTCGSSEPNDLWTFVSAGGGYYEIKNASSGKCLNVPNASTSASTQLIQYTCDLNAVNGVWQFLDVGNNYFQIYNAHSQLCVNVPNASLANGTPLIQYYCGASNGNDAWYLFT